MGISMSTESSVQQNTASSNQDQRSLPLAQQGQEETTWQSVDVADAKQNNSLAGELMRQRSGAGHGIDATVEHASAIRLSSQAETETITSNFEEDGLVGDSDGNDKPAPALARAHASALATKSPSVARVMEAANVETIEEAQALNLVDENGELTSAGRVLAHFDATEPAFFKYLTALERAVQSGCLKQDEETGAYTATGEGIVLADSGSRTAAVENGLITEFGKDGVLTAVGEAVADAGGIDAALDAGIIELNEATGVYSLSATAPATIPSPPPSGESESEGTKSLTDYEMKDRDGDGINDYGVAEEYDENGNLIGKVYVFDNDGDGKVDRMTHQMDTTGDGNFDREESVFYDILGRRTKASVGIYEFDESGNKSRGELVEDADADGSFETWKGTEYYADGELKTNIESEDTDGDGVFDHTVKTEIFDENGELIIEPEIVTVKDAEIAAEILSKDGNYDEVAGKDGKITREELRAFVDDPQIDDQELKDAAQFLLDNPVYLNAIKPTKSFKKEDLDNFLDALSKAEKAAAAEGLNIYTAPKDFDEAARILEHYWFLVDTAAGGSADDKVTHDDLKAIANGAGLPIGLQESAQIFLDSDTAWRAVGGTINRHDQREGWISSNELKKFVAYTSVAYPSTAHLLEQHESETYEEMALKMNADDVALVFYWHMWMFDWANGGGTRDNVIGEGDLQAIVDDEGAPIELRAAAKAYLDSPTIQEELNRFGPNKEYIRQNEVRRHLGFDKFWNEWDEDTHREWLLGVAQPDR